MKRLREIRTDQFGAQPGSISSNQPILPKEILGKILNTYPRGNSRQQSEYCLTKNRQ